MVQKPALLLVEDNPAEAALACTALTLHGGGLEVLEAPDLDAAAGILERSGRPMALIIIGGRALAGRPRKWRAYSALVERLLAEWLPTRKDSPPRPARTS